MFYSHEGRSLPRRTPTLRAGLEANLMLLAVLTSRKHGIATIWLVATLGSKSTLKKLTRKMILEVNIVRACETIAVPEAPMALRLQSSLLFGLCRVHEQQCTYILNDAKKVKEHLAQLIRIQSHQDLDMTPSKGPRPDQLLLQDDPAFLPDLVFANLNLDFNLEPSLPELTDGSSQGDSALSPNSPNSTQSSYGGLPQIIIPSSQSRGVGGVGGLSFGGDDSGLGDLPGIAGSALGRLDEDGGFLPDAPDFAFDEEGNLYEIEAPDSPVRPPPAIPTASSWPGSDISAFARLRAERAAAQRDGMSTGQDMDMDYDLPPIDDHLRDAEPFPQPQTPSARTHQTQANILRSSTANLAQREEEERSASAAAPMVHRRGPRPLRPDLEMELSGSVLVAWNNDYLTNMADAVARKANKLAPFQAKKNAEVWLWGAGIGGIGRQMNALNIASPLDIFYGDKFREMVTGIEGNLAGQKRDHSFVGSESSEEEGRRVRSRGDSMEAGRGAVDAEIDETGFNPIMDDYDLEIGRTAATPLAGDPIGDPSSTMPWNMSASQRSSALPLGRSALLLSRGGSISSAAPLNTIGLAGRRRTSASPLLGRGSILPPLSRQASLAPGGSSSAAGDTGGLWEGYDADGVGNEIGDANVFNAQEKFELFGPAAGVNTQTAAQNQWVRDVLDHESENFLSFVETKLSEDGEVAAGIGNEDGRTMPLREILFETLLDPQTNSKVVAAQGLLHCLTLATKGLLSVRQEEDLGSIWVAVAGGVRQRIVEEVEA